MKLSQLHEGYINTARRSMSFGRLPIEPLSSGAAIIPVEKWEKVASPTRLHKTYRFMSMDLRNRFVMSLFDYEAKVGHHAKMTIDEDSVTLDVHTRDVDQITELDKEYATYADILFKDVVYNADV